MIYDRYIIVLIDQMERDCTECAERLAIWCCVCNNVKLMCDACLDESWGRTHKIWR